MNCELVSVFGLMYGGQFRSGKKSVSLKMFSNSKSLESDTTSSDFFILPISTSKAKLFSHQGNRSESQEGRKRFPFFISWRN